MINHTHTPKTNSILSISFLSVSCFFSTFSITFHCVLDCVSRAGIWKGEMCAFGWYSCFGTNAGNTVPKNCLIKYALIFSPWWQTSCLVLKWEIIYYKWSIVVCTFILAGDIYAHASYKCRTWTICSRYSSFTTKYATNEATLTLINKQHPL